MLNGVNFANVTNYILVSSKFVYRFPEDGTDLLKRVGVVGDHTFVYICDFVYWFGFINEY